MAVFHFWQVLITIVFGGFVWIICEYIMRIAYNMYVTTFPQWATMPHVSFMLAIMNWGLWLFIMLPIAIYLWTQTQRPEV